MHLILLDVCEVVCVVTSSMDVTDVVKARLIKGRVIDQSVCLLCSYLIGVVKVIQCSKGRNVIFVRTLISRISKLINGGIANSYMIRGSFKVKLVVHVIKSDIYFLYYAVIDIRI